MTQHSNRAKTPWLFPAIVGLLVLLGIAAAYFVFFSSPGTDTSSDDSSGVVDVVEQDESDQIDLSEIERRDETDPLTIGSVGAPVALVVFSDYQCPFCATWSDETLPVMMEYVQDDQLRIEWRDVNVYGADSERASKAAYAAALQDSFWEYHDMLFSNGEIRDPSGLSEGALIDTAAELGLDLEEFEQDMKSTEVAEHILENQRLGTDIGAYSTPAFVLDGQPLLGAQPTEVFVDAMDTAISSAQK